MGDWQQNLKMKEKRFEYIQNVKPLVLNQARPSRHHQQQEPGG
jgi:hypothetical protein